MHPLRNEPNRELRNRESMNIQFLLMKTNTNNHGNCGDAIEFECYQPGQCKNSTIIKIGKW